MADEPVNVNVVEGSTSAHIDITNAEVEGQNALDTLPSPEKMGVTQAQFDKYYNSEKTEYNWKAHAKEYEFIAGQRAENQTINAESETANAEAIETAEHAVEQAGLDWDDLSRKIGANGDIDVADYEALVKLGIPQEIVKQHVDMVSGQVQDQVQAVTDAFGGREQWQQTQTWADANLEQGELDQLSTMLGGPNYKMAVDLLRQKAGTQMTTMPLGGGGTPAVEGYAPQMEMVADQRNPEYKRNPAFRDKVMQRAAASNWATSNYTTR